MMNRILSGVRRPKNTHSGVQPAWSTPDRIGWTKPLHRGAGPTGNWNHRPRAPRHTGGANPLQADRHRGPVSASVHGCAPVHPERQGRGSAIGARTGSLPAGHPSVMQGRGAAARRLMMVVLSYGARLQGATEDTAWRSPLSAPGDSADSVRYRSP